MKWQQNEIKQLIIYLKNESILQKNIRYKIMMMFYLFIYLYRIPKLNFVQFIAAKHRFYLLYLNLSGKRICFYESKGFTFFL